MIVIAMDWTPYFGGWDMSGLLAACAAGAAPLGAVVALRVGAFFGFRLLRWPPCRWWSSWLFVLRGRNNVRLLRWLVEFFGWLAVAAVGAREAGVQLRLVRPAGQVACCCSQSMRKCCASKPSPARACQR